MKQTNKGNNMKKFTLSVAAVIAMSSFAIAGGDIAPVEEPMVVAPMVEDYSSFYVGLGYSFISADIDGTEEGDAYSLIAGYNYNQYIAIEGRYTETVGDMDVSGDLSSLHHPDGDYDREVTSAAIYIKPQYPVTEEFSIYALLGYGSVDARLTSEDGFQWGLGAKYMFTENIGVYADYISLYDGDMDNVENFANNTWDSEITSTNIGVTYSF